MKRLSFALAIFAYTSVAFGAARPTATPSQSTAQRVSRTSTNTQGTPVSAPRTVTARSATQPAQPTTTSTSVARGRAAVQQSTNNARAAKQSVISTGTKVASATENTAVDAVCWSKFSGCMDSFCMLDNANGGRCICSDKNAEYDAILEEIQTLDEQSYQLATVGVERIEMGDAVDAVMSQTDSVTKRVTADANKSKRQSLDLSSWNSLDLDFDADAEEIFDLSSDGTSINNKTGDALYRAASKLCNAQIPECKSQSTLMDLMYKQRVRSDCAAYENSLRAARTQSAQKLAAAQSAMREAALEQYRNANKYDLGQCTVQFKQCMQTTGGCGEDFTGCVDLAARANSMVGLTGNTTARKQKTIKGTSSKIQISAETYDTLEAKKALCMTVTQQCVNVRDQVWDAFLREAAPQIKSAELIVESNLRTSCISNISNCFQKACHDTMDPNDPEGSYDMCLTRPDTLRSLCKVEIDPCEAAEPAIMDYVRARLKSMRVDSCTNEFKACLQSEDRCGEDYTQCIGLDTDTIVEMCPAEKLTGCKYETYSYTTKSGDKKKSIRTNAEIYNELATIATGIFLNIDNNMLTACQRAANAAMIKVCGSTENCDDLVMDNGLGSRSLEYKICEIGSDGAPDYNKCLQSIDFYTNQDINNLSGLIFGALPWYDVTVDNNNFIDISAANDTIEEITSSDNNTNYPILETMKANMKNELATLQTSVSNAIAAIESDLTVDACLKGKQIDKVNNAKSGRFDHLTDQIRRVIATTALAQAKENYYKRYDELYAQMLKDYTTAASRNDLATRRDNARVACLDLAEASSLARSETPTIPQNVIGRTTGAVAGAAIGSILGPVGTLVGAVVGWLTGKDMVKDDDSANNGSREGNDNGGSMSGANGTNHRGTSNTYETNQLVNSKEFEQWDYKETVTTTFDWTNLVCHRCIRSTTCAKTKTGADGEKKCMEWGDITEECKDTQF